MLLIWSNKDSTIDLIVEFLKFHTEIRDLQLFVFKNKHVMQILKALENNYMVKTVRLESQVKISTTVEKYALEFYKKGVGVEMWLTTKRGFIAVSEFKKCDLFYPDAV